MPTARAFDQAVILGRSCVRSIIPWRALRRPRCPHVHPAALKPVPCTETFDFRALSYWHDVDAVTFQSAHIKSAAENTSYPPVGDRSFVLRAIVFRKTGRNVGHRNGLSVLPGCHKICGDLQDLGLDRQPAFGDEAGLSVGRDRSQFISKRRLPDDTQKRQEIWLRRGSNLGSARLASSVVSHR